MYRELQPSIRYRHSEIFTVEERVMLQEMYQSQVTWLDQLQYLFPEQYRTIVTKIVGNLESETVAERALARKVGQAYWE